MSDCSGLQAAADPGEPARDRWSPASIRFLPKTRYGARWFSRPGITCGPSEFQCFLALFERSFHWKCLWLICVSLCEFSSVSTRPVTHCRSLDLHAKKSSLCCLTRTDSHLLLGSPWNLGIPSLHRIIWPPTWTQAISQAGVCCSRDDCRTSWHPALPLSALSSRSVSNPILVPSAPSPLPSKEPMDLTPKPYSGNLGQCGRFIFNYSLVSDLQPANYPSSKAKIGVSSYGFFQFIHHRAQQGFWSSAPGFRGWEAFSRSQSGVSICGRYWHHSVGA